MLDVLKHMQQELSRSFGSAQLKEDDTASFVFVENRGRAVEVSPHAGKWWVEFWEPSDDEYAPPIREATLDTPQQAIEEIISWLRGA